MPPKGPTTLKPMRLPPLKRLRVKRPDGGAGNPCLTIMSAVLSCWASSGYTSAGCQVIETQLRACMDAPKSNDKHRNTINHHLSRMQSKLTGAKKKK